MYELRFLYIYVNASYSQCTTVAAAAAAAAATAAGYKELENGKQDVRVCARAKEDLVEMHLQLHCRKSKRERE